MGAPLKELVIAHIGAIARSDSVLLLHATIFFWCVEQLLAAWGAREMEPDRLFYGEPHANDCKQMQQEQSVLEQSGRLILDPGRDDY